MGRFTPKCLRLKSLVFRAHPPSDGSQQKLLLPVSKITIIQLINYYQFVFLSHTKKTQKQFQRFQRFSLPLYLTILLRFYPVFCAPGTGWRAALSAGQRSEFYEDRSRNRSGKSRKSMPFQIASYVGLMEIQPTEIVVETMGIFYWDSYQAN